MTPYPESPSSETPLPEPRDNERDAAPDPGLPVNADHRNITILQPDAYDFWVFDLDGTLVDVETEYARSLMRRVCNRLGHRITDREADVLWYGYGEARSRLLDRRGIDPGTFWEVFHDTEEATPRAEATYLHGDANAIGDLEAPVALVTHCREYLTRPVLERHDIGDWFDAVVCCTDETGWKPDPEPVEMAMSRLDVDGNGALVGDNPEDVGAAWNTGLDGIYVTRHDPQESGHCVLSDYYIAGLDALVR